MGSDADTAARPTRRLHPWSWLFVMLAQVKEFALPLIALLVFGRGEWWEAFGIVAAVALALASVVQYFTYRYGVIGNELVVRAGVLNRNVRHIPLSRIRNVSLHRSPLHRLFGVAEVKLESAAGATAEAQMRVLSLADAAALEDLIERRRDTGDGDPAAQTEPLLALSTGELVRLGLISNRGMIVVGTAFAAMSQFAGDAFGDLIGEAGEWAIGRADALALGQTTLVAGAVLLVLAAVVALRLLSIALAVLQFHGFTLRERDGRLSVESGLLTRIRTHAPVRKIQLWTRTEGVLHRLFGRQSLGVETAVQQAANESTRAIHQLAPVATPDKVGELIARLAPGSRFPDFRWHPLHPRAWRRMAFWPVLFTLLATLPLGARFGLHGLWPLLLLPWWVFVARRGAEAAGWSLDGDEIAYRSGWLTRQLSFMEIARIQGLQLVRSPFDRRHGMATLIVDSAGAGNPFGHRIHIRLMDEADARRLFETLSRRVARSKLAW